MTTAKTPSHVRPRRWLAVALACASLGVATPPSAVFAQTAADTAVARDLFREGSQLARENKWAEARERFERSLQLKRAAITFYSLAVAQQRTGLDVEALESYRAFLAEATTAATEPYVEPAREAVATLEKRVARILVRVEPADAPDLVVSIDGHAVPASARDRPRLVNAGAHEVTAQATGYQPARDAVTVGQGGSAEVRLSLVLAPATPKALAPVAPAPGRPDSRPASSGADERPSRVVPLTLIGAGAAVFAGGLVVGIVGMGQADSAPTRDGADASAARTKGVVADVLMATGIVAAGAGVVLWLVQGPSKSPARTAVGHH